MSSGEIHWLPRQPDKFVVLGADIKLYSYNENQPDNTLADLSLPSFSVLASESKLQFIRTIAPSFHADTDLIAAGLVSGKVSLLNFRSAGAVAPHEFIPRSTRSCLALAWLSSAEPNVLAIGHDKSKVENCVTVWDAASGTVLSGFGGADAVLSLCWTPSRLLVAGAASKQIRMFDLREKDTAVATMSTKQTLGLVVAPNGHSLAGFGESVVSLFDLRSLDKQICSIAATKNVSGLEWLPTRASALSVLQTDSQYFYLHELHWPDAEGDPLSEPFSIRRRISPVVGRNDVRAATLTDLSWHPSESDRVLALCSSGLICDYRVPPRQPAAWSGSHLWTGVNTELKGFSNLSPVSTPEGSLDRPAFDDIGELMQYRAIKDYGQVNEIEQNGDLACDDSLRCVWRLLAHMHKQNASMLGVKCVLGISGYPEGSTSTRSDTIFYEWVDFPSFPALKIFRSAPRSHVQALCGWTFDRDNEQSFGLFIDKLCLQQEYTRAALIATFHLRLREATEILNRAAPNSNATSSLAIAAIALASFSPDKVTSWRTQMSLAQITDPHLRALFTFLAAADGDHYEAVLGDAELSLADRLAFAALYLSDARLAEFVRGQITRGIDGGRLEALLLTGITADGVELLQSYVDASDDIQTVALVVARFFGADQFSNYRVQCWITAYRALLDAWRLWEQRAAFDIMTAGKQSTVKSVSLLCNFCGKSVAASDTVCAAMQMRSVSAAALNRLASCPHCRKPLPRCSLCLLHMGTSTTSAIQKQARRNNLGWQVRPIGQWFAWCQTCRHGGHSDHLAAWFEQYAECPVTLCNCTCFELDRPTTGAVRHFAREKT